MDKDLRGRQAFGHTRHYSCWKPYFYKEGYTWDYLSGASPYKIPPIAVKEDGSCLASDIEWDVQVVTNNKGEVTGRTPFWECGSRCRPVSQEEVDNIVALKDMFGEDMPQFLKALGTCDECPYTHSYRQHWHFPLKVLMPRPHQNSEDKPDPKADPKAEQPDPDEKQD